METVRYVIVVHGMGEARKNETVLSVINRFAEARAEKPWPEPDDVLTLGKASSQTGRVPDPAGCRYDFAPPQFAPWLDFKGIPQPPEPPMREPFIGERGTGPAGENLRFADAHWADLLAEDFSAVGQDPIAWTDGLLGRLRRKDEYAVRTQGERVPPWALRILELIQQTVVVVHGIARVRAKEFDTLVFDKYLGDVQLYGEFAQSRGRAMRRFHRLMHRIENAHREEEKNRKEKREARYTVIAHSLGTVMSMDALLYACARRDLRIGKSGASKDPNFPFPEYLNDSDSNILKKAGGDVEEAIDAKADLGYLDTSWIRRVDSFVTLGSPIDKFLILWWMNYSHLTETEWMDPKLQPEQKILHFNYCEEQDPVGHKLDFVESTPAFKEVFETKDDRVYVRSAIPGLAHTAYWEDRDLFRWILHRAVDLDKGAAPEPQWFLPEAYQKVLSITYRWVPNLLILASLFLFTWAWLTDSAHGAILAAAGLSLVLFLGKRVMDLFLWWRQVLRAKEPGVHPVGLNTLGELGRDVITYLSGPVAYKPGREGEIKDWEQSWFRIWLRFSSYGTQILSGLLFGTYLLLFDLVYPEGRTRDERALLIALVMLACALLWKRLLPKSNLRADTGRGAVPWSLLQVALWLGIGAWVMHGVPAEGLHAILKDLLGKFLPRLLFLGTAYSFFAAAILTYRYRAFRWIRKAMAAPKTVAKATKPDFQRYSGATT